MRQSTTSFHSKFLPWLLFAFVSIFTIIGWLYIRDWSIYPITALSIFPVLGIYAWSIMWTHYIISTNRLLNPSVGRNKQYSFVSSLIVFALILLHPGLIIWSMWSNLGTLPPGSIYSYVGESMKVFIILGLVSLVIFLSFDVFSKYRNRSIVKRNWRWISLLQMIAMILIFIHGIGLGYILENTAFRIYWLVLGTTLIPCFAVVIKNDWKNNGNQDLLE